MLYFNECHKINDAPSFCFKIFVGASVLSSKGTKLYISLQFSKEKTVKKITRIMVFKGMVFKSKYWFWEKNKGFFLSEYLNFGELKGSHKGIQYWFSFKL